MDNKVLIEDAKTTYEDWHYMRVLGYACLPFATLLLSVVLTPFLLCCRSKHERASHPLFLSFFQRVVVTTGVCLYLVYPSIILVLFQSIHCVEIAGQDVLWANPQITCYDEKYNFYFWVVTIPAIVAWIIILPFLWLSLKIHGFNKFWLTVQQRRADLKSKFKDMYLFSVGFFVLGLKNAARRDTIEENEDDFNDDLGCCPST